MIKRIWELTEGEEKERQGGAGWENRVGREGSKHSTTEAMKRKRNSDAKGKVFKILVKAGQRKEERAMEGNKEGEGGRRAPPQMTQTFRDLL